MYCKNLFSVSDIPAEPSAIPACDCDKCVCCPCLDPNQVKTSRAMGGDQIPATASQNLPIPTVPCDCTECICSPCADPRKRKGRTAPLSANVSSADRPPHPEGCICDACLCGEDGEIEDGTPGLGPQIDQKMSQVASGLGGPQVGQKMSKVASGRWQKLKFLAHTHSVLPLSTLSFPLFPLFPLPYHPFQPLPAISHSVPHISLFPTLTSPSSPDYLPL